MLTIFMDLALAAPLRYAEDQAPGIVNPLFSTTMSEARVSELLFDSLYTDTKDLATTPAMVDVAELSSDMMQMEIRLKDGMTWHDGSPVGSSDVVFTIEAMRNAKTLSTEAGRVDWIAKAEVTGPLNLKLTFKQPEPHPEEKLFFKILPAAAFSNNTEISRTHPFRTKPIGSGPYSLVQYNDDNSITFQAHPGFRVSGGIPELVMREVADKSYQAKLLIYESLEALVRVLPRDLAVLQNNRKVELYPYQTNSWWYVGFNMRQAPFDDPKVREALAWTVDIPALLAPIGTGEILSGPFVRSSPYYNHEITPRDHDELRAASLLEEAGWARGADGIWTKGGKPLKFTVSAHKTLESAQEVVINLQSQLRGAGMQVEVEFLEEAEWKSRIWREHDYEVVLSQWSFDRNEDVREQLYSTGSRNFGGYKNPQVDTLLDQARSARDPQVKKDALRKVHTIVATDVPAIYLWTLDSWSAVSTKVTKVVIHPFYFFTWVTDWRMAQK